LFLSAVYAVIQRKYELLYTTKRVQIWFEVSRGKKSIRYKTMKREMEIEKREGKGRGRGRINIRGKEIKKI